MDAGLKQLKVKVTGKTVAGSEFQSLGVIGIKELAKDLSISNSVFKKSKSDFFKSNLEFINKQLKNRKKLYLVK